MLETAIEKPVAEDLESPSERRDRALAGDSRHSLPRPTAAAAKGFHARYPEARAIRREG
jgi:hypothetical protein